MAEADTLAAGLQDSHQNGGASFLNFVADPRTARWCRFKGRAVVGELSTTESPAVPVVTVRSETDTP